MTSPEELLELANEQSPVMSLCSTVLSPQSIVSDDTTAPESDFICASVNYKHGRQPRQDSNAGVLTG